MATRHIRTTDLALTQTRADRRLYQLEQQGHHLTIDSDLHAATVTITRNEGYAYHITITPENLEPHTLQGAPYRRHPQTVLISHAILAIAEWSAERDKAQSTHCHVCTQHTRVRALYNPVEENYDWYCPTCLYGEAA